VDLLQLAHAAKNRNVWQLKCFICISLVKAAPQFLQGLKLWVLSVVCTTKFETFLMFWWTYQHQLLRRIRKPQTSFCGVWLSFSKLPVVLCVCVCFFWYEVKEHGYEFFVSLGNHFHWISGTTLNSFPYGSSILAEEAFYKFHMWLHHIAITSSKPNF
jgi:hypothetical protein